MKKHYTRQFLEQQLKWCQEQDHILEQIEAKLDEMKEITEYAAAINMNPI